MRDNVTQDSPTMSYLESNTAGGARERLLAFSRALRTQATILGTAAAVMWFLEIVDTFLLRGALNAFGVRPREAAGLAGIFFMPWLHGSLAHVAANTLPLVVLGWLVMVRRTADFFVVTAMVVVVSGLGVWLTGPARSVHIGSSGLIFGYFGFLLLRGYFDRHAASILLAVLVGLLYGSIIWGVLPQTPGISWQTHLFGFVGGVAAARLLADRQPGDAV